MNMNLQFFGGRGNAGNPPKSEGSGKKGDLRDLLSDKSSKAKEGKDKDVIELRGKDSTNQELIKRLENSGWKLTDAIRNRWEYDKTGKVTSAKSKTGTMSTNKSSEQIYKEVEQLKNLPSGTKIERIIDGKTVIYMAHDVARTGRNGRISRIRKFSIITAPNKNGTGITHDTTDPYYVAQGQWKKKSRG